MLDPLRTLEVSLRPGEYMRSGGSIASVTVGPAARETNLYPDVDS